MSALIGKLALSGAGVGAFLFVLARLIPNERLDSWGFIVGSIVTGFGAGKLGSKTWEMIESFLENSSGAFLDGVKKGLDRDDVKDAPEVTNVP